MSQEIERKFLVRGEFKSFAFRSFIISQGYLCSDPERSVRIRIRENKAFLTIKGRGSADGTTRYEWEKEIEVADARDLMQLCEPGIIEKKRYLVKSGEHIFEVDEFFGENSPLTLAEIELNSNDESFEKPSWLGEEVTGDARYYNSSLKNNPYQAWR